MSINDKYVFLEIYRDCPDHSHQPTRAHWSP